MGCINVKSGSETAGGNKISRPKIRSGEESKQQTVQELKQNYHIDEKTKILGSGAFGRVFMTTNRHDKDFKVAIKVLDKVKLKNEIEYIMDEVAILHSLDHPNIVKYYETYNDVKYFYLVMEYIQGMPLFTRITQQEN